MCRQTQDHSVQAFFFFFLALQVLLFFLQHTHKKLANKGHTAVLPRPNRPWVTWGHPKEPKVQKYRGGKTTSCRLVGSFPLCLSYYWASAKCLITASSRQDLPRSQCSLEKMSLVGRSRHDFKKNAGEGGTSIVELDFGWCFVLFFENFFSRFDLSAPLSTGVPEPLYTCASSHQFFGTGKINVEKLLSPFHQHQHFE